jgi:DNA-binding transcriptional LysR family regulator
VTTSSFHAQFEAVRAGLGVAVLPTALCIADAALEPLDVPGLPRAPTLDLYLVTPRALRRVPRVAVVFDALVAEFARATG